VGVVAGWRRRARRAAPLNGMSGGGRPALRSLSSWLGASWRYGMGYAWTGVRIGRYSPERVRDGVTVLIKRLSAVWLAYPPI